MEKVKSLHILGREDAVVQALFDAYFLRGEDIGNIEVLTAAAETGGLDAEPTRTFLEAMPRRRTCTTRIRARARPVSAAYPA